MFWFLIILTSAVDPDDPLADLLDDLLPDETKSKPSTQQPKPEKLASPPSTSLDLKTKTKTRKPGVIHNHYPVTFPSNPTNTPHVWVCVYQQRQRGPGPIWCLMMMMMIRMTWWTHSDSTAIKTNRRKKRLRFGPARKGSNSVCTLTVSLVLLSLFIVHKW